MAKLWKIALGVGCAVVLLALAAVVLLPLGLLWLEGRMQAKAAEPLTAMEILECEVDRDGSSIAVRGSLRNGGEGPVRDVSVKLRWTDGSESVIPAGTGEVTPGERAEFEYLREDPSGAIDGIDCQVNCVTTEQAMICR